MLFEAHKCRPVTLKAPFQAQDFKLSPRSFSPKLSTERGYSECLMQGQMAGLNGRTHVGHCQSLRALLCLRLWACPLLSQPLFQWANLWRAESGLIHLCIEAFNSVWHKKVIHNQWINQQNRNVFFHGMSEQEKRSDYFCFFIRYSGPQKFMYPTVGSIHRNSVMASSRTLKASWVVTDQFFLNTCLDKVS